MRIIGARMRTPATSVSKARSYSPSKWETSVEVPPMSKPMTLPKPARRAVSTAATTPPAGPERIASLPWNSVAAVSPPDDCMNIRRGALIWRGGRPWISEFAVAGLDSSCATLRT